MTLGFLVAGIGFAFLIPTGASAAETLTLETIQVRGNKEDRNYFENPESISILQEDKVPTTGRENNLQVLNAVPNVDVNKNGDSISIRGINSSGVTGFQKDNLSSLMIDDLFQTDLALQASSFNLWDLERIEVLRGAQSTSQGVNALAGTVLLDHHRPAFLSEGAAKLGFGSFWWREAGLVVNQPVVQNRLAARVSYVKEMTNGYITNTATDNDQWARWNRDRVNLGLLYQVTDSTQLSLNGKVNLNSQGGTYTQGVDAFQYQVNEDVDYQVNTQNYQLSTSLSQTLSGSFKNHAILGFSRSFQDGTSDADGTPQATAGTRLEDHNDHFVSFEDRIYWTHERFSNLLGVHTHDFKLADRYDFNLLYPLTTTVSTPIAVHQDVDRTRRVYALFDSLTFHLSDRHSLLAGARIEHVDSTYGTGVLGTRNNNLGTSINTTVDTYLSQISGNYSGTRSNTVILPKLGYTFHQDGHYAGIFYTRGYRTSGVSINRRKATAVEYDPEFTNNYETSYKYSGRFSSRASASSARFQLGLNLFYIDWRDQQVQVQLSSDFYDTQVQNAARSEVYGGELEASLSPFSSHTVAGGLGYAHTEFKAFETRNGNYAGNQFPFAPHWTSRLSYEWKATDQLSVLSILRYVGESYGNAENTRDADRQFYLNTNIRYLVKEWLFEGYINNLFNGQYRIFDGTPTSSTSPYQASYHQTSTPREFGIRVTYYF